MNDAEVKKNLPPLTTSEVAVVKKNRVEFKSYQENVASFDRKMERLNYEFRKSKLGLLDSLEKLRATTGRAKFGSRSGLSLVNLPRLMKN